MRIRRCDRCGEVYDSYNDHNTLGITEFNMNDEQIGGEDYTDLCPKCMTEFKTWLDAHKK